ncbi:MAG: AmmeMemoRadiSam system protein A [Planctomycetota bacterium]
MTAEQRKFLRETALDSIRAALLDQPHDVILPESGLLAEPGSAFVTLRSGGRLRGCIGLIGERFPLGQSVREAARRALDDPRFPSVTADELPELELEVSVLTPFRPLAESELPEVGRHGLYIEAGHHTGLLLPQVAAEQGWDRETFLDHVCMKAGLPADQWRGGEARISVFEADVF